MLYIPKIHDYLEILTHEEMKDFVAISFRESSKSIKEEQNLRQIAKLLHIFLTTSDDVENYAQSNSYDNYIHHYNVEILDLFNPELELINTKPMIKNKFKELLNELKKFKVQTVLVLDYKKRNDRKIFHSSNKLIATDSDIDEALNPCIKALWQK